MASKHVFTLIHVFILILVQLLFCCASAEVLLGRSEAQEDPAAPAVSGVDNEYVQKTFGKSCTLNPGVAPVKADLNSDGVEDVVIAARCTEPMLDAAEHNYIVLDPRNAFYGFGNPTITTQYSTELPEERGLALLIVHGTGVDAWRSATTAGKFLVVNLPYKQIDVKKLRVKKKTVTGIYVLETGSDQMTSALYWDTKKYRYQPVGASMH